MIDTALIAISAGVLASSGALSATVAAVKSQLSRNRTRHITLQIGSDTLELSGELNEDAKKRLTEFIQRHEQHPPA